MGQGIEMFVGRQQEIKAIEQLLRKKTSSLMTITGRRRIGKSRLVEELARRNSDYQLLSFSGLSPRPGVSAEVQRKSFALRLQGLFQMAPVDASDWSYLLQHLSDHCRDKKVIVLLDEISWLGHGDPDFLGKLKNSWDLSLKHNPELLLILCGSVSSWIEKNILSSTGFMGRVSLRIHLEELSLVESCSFLGGQGVALSAYEKFKILAVTGGVPRYLEEILPDMSAEQNIRRLCYQKEGILFNEFEDIFHDLFGNNEGRYMLIVELLSSGPKVLLEICDHLGVEKSGKIVEYLDDLVKSGFVSRDFTWDLKGSKSSKLSQYRLKDNYLRFYLHFIKQYKAQIEAGSFKHKSQTALPGWESIMGLQFENLVINNRHLLWELLSIPPEEVINDGPFFQTKTNRRQGCQIDYLVQGKYGTLYVAEIKFSRKPLSLKIIDEMRNRLLVLSCGKHQSKIPILIHVNGVEESVIEEDYFARVIDFSSFLV